MLYSTNGGTATKGLPWIDGFLLANCELTRTAQSDQLLLAQHLGGVTAEPRVNGVHSWKNNYDQGEHDGLAIINVRVGSWFTSLGDTLAGLDGASITLDHHIYNSVHQNQSYKYMNHEPAFSANLAFKINIDGDHVGQFVLIDDCDVTGTQNGMGISNNDNSYTGARNYQSYFDNVVIQKCRIHTGVIGTQHNGILAYNLDKIVVRYCNFWNNHGVNLVSSDETKPTKWFVYHNNFHGDCPAIQIRQDGGYFWYNKIHNTDDDKNVPLYVLSAKADLDTWSFDYNQYYAPNSSDRILHDETLTAYLTFPQWQMQTPPRDPNGSYGDPGFADPANGDFT